MKADGQLDALIPCLRSNYYQTEPLYAVEFLFEEKDSDQQHTYDGTAYILLPASALERLPAFWTKQIPTA